MRLQRVEESPREAQRNGTQASIPATSLDAAAKAAERFARGLLGKLGVTLRWATLAESPEALLEGTPMRNQP